MMNSHEMAIHVTLSNLELVKKMANERGIHCFGEISYLDILNTTISFAKLPKFKHIYKEYVNECSKTQTKSSDEARSPQ